jgi:hypothetical protein
LFQNFSFGTTTLDLIEKAGFRPLFRKPVLKLTGFWNRLRQQQKAEKVERQEHKVILSFYIFNFLR